MNLIKRIERIETSRDSTVRLDAAQQILAGREQSRPRRTRAALEAQAADDGLIGRIARADLRIGRIGDRTEPIADPETEIALQMGEFFADPIGFVMWAYEWSSEPSLSVVPLPELQIEYRCEHGPEQWAFEFFADIARQVQQHGFDGTAPVDAIRMAIASGHGISKSATTAMLVNFIMSTRPNARGVITASTSVQLESKTWPEVQKWTRRSITGHWFEISAGRGAMRMLNRNRPESWRCDAQTSREENSESFAGLHAADSTPFFIFDESSGVPDAIHQVAQGGLTDGEPMMFAFGNPTKNTGWFHAAFNSQRHRWLTRQIDSRKVHITNKRQLQEWIDDFGLDSDFVKVRVRGIFPSASSLQFIGRDLIDGAMGREIPEQRGEAAIVGVDVARFGDDQSVVRTRIGRDATGFPPIRLRGADTMQVASRAGEHANYLESLGLRVHIFVDGGGVGGGVVDRLRQLGFDVVEAQFGGKADDPRKYANKRAEIWGRLKDWLKGGSLPRDEQLATDLSSVEYGFNQHDQIQLERKESMRARGVASPDDADALAITFAFPVRIEMGIDMPMSAQVHARDYDPMEHSIMASGHDPYAKSA